MFLHIVAFHDILCYEFMEFSLPHTLSCLLSYCRQAPQFCG